MTNGGAIPGVDPGALASAAIGATLPGAPSAEEVTRAGAELEELVSDAVRQ